LGAVPGEARRTCELSNHNILVVPQRVKELRRLLRAMVKCPFCGFENEEGALFCEQCKSDLSGVPSSAPAAAPPAADVVEAAPVAEVIEAAPVADVVEAAPVAPPVEAPPAPAAEAPPAPPAPAPAAPPAPAPAPAPAAEAPPAPAPAAPPAPAAGAPLPEGAAPKLRVIRGQKINHEFPIYEGNNFIGRADEQPVDIDLEDQEPPDRIWCSRQHALVIFENNNLKLEDLNSSNGTYLNRQRVHPGQPRELKPGDVIQIGTVQLRVMV
jgi:hypothetical protein